MKFLWIPLTLLLSVSTLMLLYQWDQSEMGSGKVSKSPELDVSITVKENQLQFGYTYEQLKAGIYTLQTADGISEIMCSQKESPCRVTNQENPEMIIEKPGKVVVNYTLSMPADEVIHDWMLELKKEGRVVQPPFSLTIQDFDEVKDSWLVPSVKKSDFQMENLRFYSFPSMDEPLPLARKGDASIWHNGKSIITYDAARKLSTEDKQDIQDFLDLKSPVLIQLDQSETKVSDHFMKVEGRDVKGLQGEYLEEHLRNVTSESNPWELQIVKDIFTKRKTSMANEVASAFTEDELRMLREKLLQDEQINDLGIFLDQTLSNIYGVKTSYFQNYQAPSEDHLYFIEERDVFHKKQPITDRIVHYHGESYLSIRDISRAMDYEYTEIEQDAVYNIKIPGKEYRFYIDQPTFIVNNESFGVGEDLLIMLDSSPFMRKQDLQELLNVNLTYSSK